jgi:hypothetical protein
VGLKFYVRPLQFFYSFLWTDGYLMMADEDSRYMYLRWIKDPHYLLTPSSRVLLEKLTGFAASQEIPCIYGTRKFITLLTSARHLLRDTPPRNTHSRRSDWGSRLQRTHIYIYIYIYIYIWSVFAGYFSSLTGVEFSRNSDWCDVEPITHCPFVLLVAAHRIYIFLHDILWCIFSVCWIREIS